jgi:hypothetical protein
MMVSELVWIVRRFEARGLRKWFIAVDVMYVLKIMTIIVFGAVNVLEEAH